MRIHHLGYLVKNAASSEEIFLELGYRKKGTWVLDEKRGLEILFLEKDGYCIELLVPRTAESPFYSLLVRYRNTVYHICYETDDYEDTIKKFERKGFMCVAPPEPAPALQMRKAAFYAHPQMGMVEILESGKDGE